MESGLFTFDRLGVFDLLILDYGEREGNFRTRGLEFGLCWI
jgi:hypothetical protein